MAEFFYLPKKDKSFRFILNLKKLNEYIYTDHFKLENHKTAINLLEEGYFMATIDLRDAYYLLPIHESHRKYLRFRYEGILYEFTCLPFGLNVAPYIFTKLLKPLVELMRKKGYLSVIYLDDILLIGDSYLSCKRNFIEMSRLLVMLGFVIHDLKSQPVHVNRCKWLGLIFDT